MADSEVVKKAARLMADNNRAVWDDPDAREYFLSDARALAERGLLVDTAPVGQPLQPWQARLSATGGGPCPTCRKPFYTHVCIGCSPDYQTPGPGCINCRQTGMDQTPCLPPADRDGGERR